MKQSTTIWYKKIPNLFLDEKKLQLKPNFHNYDTYYDPKSTAPLIVYFITNKMFIPMWVFFKIFAVARCCCLGDFYQSSAWWSASFQLQDVGLHASWPWTRHDLNWIYWMYWCWSWKPISSSKVNLWLFAMKMGINSHTKCNIWTL